MQKPWHGQEQRNRRFAKSMRGNPTEAERVLWLILKGRRFAGYKFRRQVPIGPYIVDFACFSPKLIIELDGSQHADSAPDAARDAWLESRGFAVARIWNSQLNAEPAAVGDAIWARLERRHGC